MQFKKIFLFLSFSLIFLQNAFAEVFFGSEIFQNQIFEEKISDSLRTQRAFVNRELGNGIYKIVIDSPSIKEKIVGNYDLRILNVNKISKIFTAELTQEFSSEAFSFNGHYEEFLMVPTLRYKVSSGDAIWENDLVLSKINISKVKKNTITSIHKIAGSVARNNLQPNLPIQESDLSKPHLVKKKKTVTIFYDDRNLSLKALGIALEDGSDGDVVKVKNSQTNIIVNGTVEGANSVRVKP